MGKKKKKQSPDEQNKLRFKIPKKDPNRPPIVNYSVTMEERCAIIEGGYICQRNGTTCTFIFFSEEATNRFKEFFEEVIGFRVQKVAHNKVRTERIEK